MPLLDSTDGVNHARIWSVGVAARCRLFSMSGFLLLTPHGNSFQPSRAAARVCCRMPPVAAISALREVSVDEVGRITISESTGITFRLFDEFFSLLIS